MNILAVANDAYLVSMTAREWSHLAGLEIGHDFPTVATIGACCDVLNRIEKPVAQHDWRQYAEPCLAPDDPKQNRDPKRPSEVERMLIDAKFRATLPADSEETSEIPPTSA